MHHMYPVSKGDQLCPLGFHPQVRWPTRCKRCFRDYKEHGGKRGDDVAASSPSLSDTNGRSRDSNGAPDRASGRNWTSTSNLSSFNNSAQNDGVHVGPTKRPSSWTSTPDLDEKPPIRQTDNSIDVNVLLPRRRHTTTLDMEESVTVRRPPIPPLSKEAPEDLVILRSDSLAERARKMQLIKKQNSIEREMSRERSLPRAMEREKSPSPVIRKRHEERESQSRDSKYLSPQDSRYQMRDSPKPTTPNEEIELLKRELELARSRAERAEIDKSDLMLRRLASMDTVSNRSAAGEAMKLQQKVNELNQQLEDTKDEKKALANKIRDLEKSSNARAFKSVEEEMRKKLQAAEQLCEELMDENNEIKRDLRNMEQEAEEMQDTFREDQADEYSTIKKELEVTTKNCRILSFKLKKSERKIEQMENEKQTNSPTELINQVKKLEEDLRIANEVARQLQLEAEKNQSSGKGKTPTLGVLGKSSSADGKFSRSSLTRGGSQEDPVQLMRDLQDSMEREADIREQLKFAEEEADSLRKKAQRVEDENESLMMQLKKMATKARSRKLSPTAPSRLTTDSNLDKDEGISDEEDPAELRVLLDLNEREASQLRRKVEELEISQETSKKQIKELQEKCKAAGVTGKDKLSAPLKTAATAEKIKIKDNEISELQLKLNEKERAIEKLKAELKAKTGKSIDSISDLQSTVNHKRQLELVEQEATILRGKVSKLEQEIDGVSTENKKLTVQVARLARKDSNSSEKDAKGSANIVELNKTKDALAKLEKEHTDLQGKLKNIEVDVKKLPIRIPKKFTDLTTKMQLQKMVGDLEDEIRDLRTILARNGGGELQKNFQEIKQLQEQLGTANSEIRILKSKKDTSTTQASKILELENKYKEAIDESKRIQTKIRDLEERLIKQDSVIKQQEAAKSLLEAQIKTERERVTKAEKECDKERKERIRWESKVSDLDADLSALRTRTQREKSALEREVVTLKASNDSTPSKKLEEMRKQNAELQSNLDRESQKCADLTGKYEHLEEEHILTKAQLTTDKEGLQANLTSLKDKLASLEGENGRFKKDNIDLSRKIVDMQNKYKELENKQSRNTSLEYEKKRLSATLQQREQDFALLSKENAMNADQGIQLRRENDELRKKLTDFEKVNKVQSSLTDHSSSLEQELKKLRAKLENTEMVAKSDVAATRLRYEQQVKNLQDELNSNQKQCERFKRDRDSFKELLEAAQKSIKELKSNSGRVSRASLNSGDEDDKSRILVLEQQLGSLEDELCEARLDTSKLKTDLVTEKTVSEIKISELQSRLNEYEEERLLGSGRTKIPGIKTRLELSWQKEREDQQRLLQETSTLARDLRQTLFEVERERDKERLEGRRKLDQLKKANDEELDEGRRKISELQCDLLELRDAHAKLRTSNEKLRRERERFERERDNYLRRRAEQESGRGVGTLLQTIDELVKLAPELAASSNATSRKPSTPSTPTRLLTKQSSTDRKRSPSPVSDGTITSIINRLSEVSDEVRRHQRMYEEEREREKMRRTMRRAASTENETPEMQRRAHRLSKSATHNGSLYRKSLSFDQTVGGDQKLWKTADGYDSMSSMQSIDSEMGGTGGFIRDSSMDSRLSGGSTQSDMPRGTRKKKRGLMGKLRSLTKSGRNDSEASVQGSDSDVSTISLDHKSSKTNLKDRLSDMFKRAGSNSRSNSTEVMISSSNQRPITISASTDRNGRQSNPTTPHLARTTSKPPTSAATTPTPIIKRKTNIK